MTSILPFDAIVNVVTQDYTLDLESWDLHVTLESVYSTHANRAASDDFNLQLKDVCWDLPLAAAPAAPGNFNEKLWSTHRLTFSAMNTQWNDYCGGFTYRVEYVTGPLYTGLVGEVKPDFAAVYTHTLDTLYVEGTPTDTDWVGVHTLKIVGTYG